jgi:hypothetical protein
MNSGYYYGYLNNLKSNQAAPMVHTLKLEKLASPDQLNRGLKQSMLFLMPANYNGNVFYREGPIKLNFSSQRLNKKLKE